LNSRRRRELHRLLGEYFFCPSLSQLLNHNQRQLSVGRCGNRARWKFSFKHDAIIQAAANVNGPSARQKKFRVYYPPEFCFISSLDKPFHRTKSASDVTGVATLTAVHSLRQGWGK
jgi:hypothetical protein